MFEYFEETTLRRRKSARATSITNFLAVVPAKRGPGRVFGTNDIANGKMIRRSGGMESVIGISQRGTIDNNDVAPRVIVCLLLSLCLLMVVENTSSGKLVSQPQSIIALRVRS